MRFSKVFEVSCQRQGKLLFYSDVESFQDTDAWSLCQTWVTGWLCLQLVNKVTISAKQEEEARNGATDEAGSHRPRTVLEVRPWHQERKGGGKAQPKS